MEIMVIGSRFGLTLGIAQVEVYASAAARAAVLEAERVAQIAAGHPDDTGHRPTRLSELLVDHADRAGIHAVLRDVAEAQAELHALQAAAITRLAALQPAQTELPGAAGAAAGDGTHDCVADDWVADEVAVVLGISTSSATSLVGKQRALVDQLPQVWAALADGRIDVRRATVLVDTLAHRKQSAGGALPDDVVDHAAHQGLAWIAEGIGPTPLGERVAGALIAADPAEAERRAERRRAKQNTTTASTGDGLATFRSDHLDADKAAQMQTVVNALAATMKKGGDRRPIGVLRTEAHHQLITRPGQPLPDDVAAARWNLHLRADLADLDHHGPLSANPADIEARNGSRDDTAADPTETTTDDSDSTAHPRGSNTGTSDTATTSAAVSTSAAGTAAATEPGADAAAAGENRASGCQLDHPDHPGVPTTKATRATSTTPTTSTTSTTAGSADQAWAPSVGCRCPPSPSPNSSPATTP